MPPATQEEAAGYRVQAPDWRRLDNQRTYRFPNFPGAFAFVERAAALESPGYYPEITIGWGYAPVSLHTKKIKGRHESDFIMAAKIDRIAPGRPHRQTKTEPLPSASRGWVVPEHIGATKNSLNSQEASRRTLSMRPRILRVRHRRRREAR